MAHAGDIGIDIAPEVTDDPEPAARLDDLLHRTCHLARALTGAEQAAFKVDLDGRRPRRPQVLQLERAVRALARLPCRSPGVGPPRDRPRSRPRNAADPVRGRGAPRLARLRQPSAVPPADARLAATAVFGEGDRRYGMLQLSDKAGGGDFTPEDADRLRELAAYAGAALDAFRAASRGSGSE